MILAFLFICGITYFKGKTLNPIRRNLILLFLLLYLIISFLDMLWLFSVEERPLHPSDPTEYYEKVKDLNFTQVLDLESSNSFYFIVNWFLNLFWDNPYWISIWVKIDNCLLAVFIYLLLTHNRHNVTKWDYILMLNPYMILTINRNVRDLYIILFVLVILIGLHTIKNLRLPKICVLCAIFSLSITRIILFAPILAVWLFQKWNTLSKKMRYFGVLIVVVAIFCAFTFIMKTMVNQMVSSMDFGGENIEELMPLISGNYSLGSFVALFKRLLIATFVFVFTPNPINFFNSWMTTMNDIGGSNIYTGIDNFIILIGSLYYYIFIVPYIFYCIFRIRTINKSLILFTVIFSILYIISYLGQTDIRNHNTAIFFFIVSLMNSHSAIKLKTKDYLLSLGACFGLSII
ncbi:MAG: hypothetical protein K2L45_06660 [Muribaculaceae bacterium]|nr:hypothetical protein [Muribaculaceae bacterium]